MPELLEREAYGPVGDPSRHRPLAELEAGLRALGAAPRDSGRLALIVRRRADGVRETPERVELSPEEGVPGDGWSRRPPRDPEAQLAVMRRDVAELLANGQPLTLFGDNLFVDLDVSAANLPAGTRLRVGEAVIEMTAEPHDGCRKFKGRFGQDALRLVQAKATRDQNLRGVYWKVVEGGEARVGDAIEVLARARAAARDAAARAATIKLYFAPRTRAFRVLWLLEELGLPYELERVEFLPPAKTFFAQRTPLGKLPTIVDGDVVLCESGAIVEYVLERYGRGRLAPPVGSRERPRFLQWLHFAESTAFPPLGILVWLTRYRDDASDHAVLVEDTRARAVAALDFVERELGGSAYLAGDEFSAADVMMGFTLAAARALGVLGERHPALRAYLARLESRPAFQKAARVA